MDVSYLLVEIFMKVTDEWFSNDSRGRQGIFMCLAVLLQIRGWRCQDIDQVLLHEITFWSVYVAAVKCQAKIPPFGVNCRLQLTAIGKKRKETVKPTCFSLLYRLCRKRLQNHRQIIHSILRPLRRKIDRRLKISAR